MRCSPVTSSLMKELPRSDLTSLGSAPDFSPFLTDQKALIFNIDHIKFSYPGCPIFMVSQARHWI